MPDHSTIDGGFSSVRTPSTTRRRALIVGKVGGSLADLDDLPARLLRRIGRDPIDRWLLVSGAGPAGDWVRAAADRFDYSEDQAHRLAVRAMTFQARLLAAALADAVVCDSFDRACAAWRAGRVPVVDADAWLSGPEAPELPIGWHVTSDSIAAALARRLAATRLVLFKSIGSATSLTVAAAVERGWLDPYFPDAVGVTPVEWVNLRLETTTELITRPTNDRPPADA